MIQPRFELLITSSLSFRSNYKNSSKALYSQSLSQLVPVYSCSTLLMHSTHLLLIYLSLIRFVTACLHLTGIWDSKLLSLYLTFYDNGVPVCSTVTDTSINRPWDGRGELAISCFDTSHYAWIRNGGARTGEISAGYGRPGFEGEFEVVVTNPGEKNVRKNYLEAWVWGC